MINHPDRAEVVDRVPPLHEADDPNDSWLLSLADIGNADFLVTGDKKAAILRRGRVASAQVVTATAYCKRFDSSKTW